MRTVVEEKRPLNFVIQLYSRYFLDNEQHDHGTTICPVNLTLESDSELSRVCLLPKEDRA